MKSNLGPQKVRHWGAAHWGARMARVGLLHSIGSLGTIKMTRKKIRQYQCTNRVDAELVGFRANLIGGFRTLDGGHV